MTAPQSPTGLTRLLRRLTRRIFYAPARAPRAIAKLARRPLALFRRRSAPPPGASPGSLAIAPEALPPQIKAIVYDAQHLEEYELRDAAGLAALRGEDRVLWIDVAGFGDEHFLAELRDRFAIHPLALADAINVPQRPKVEDYGDRYLIVTRMAQPGAGGEIDLEQVSILLGPGWLITFQERPGDVFDPVRRRLRNGIGLIRTMKQDYLAYALIDAVIDGYFPVLESVGESVEALEEEVMGQPTRETMVRIHAARRTLLALHRVQWRQRDAMLALLRDDLAPISAPVRVYLRDACDHAYQTVDAIETYRELAVGLMDIYLSSVSNRMNEVMKTLTVMASIFIPLTFLAGVYGMNFEFMPELHWRWAYPILLLIMGGVAGALLVWFRRRGWLAPLDPAPPPPNGETRAPAPPRA